MIDEEWVKFEKRNDEIEGLKKLIAEKNEEIDRKTNNNRFNSRYER